MVYKFSNQEIYDALRDKIISNPDTEVKILIYKDEIKSKTQKWLDSLLQLGNNTEVRYWQAFEPYGKLHAKFYLSDKLGITGSPNLSTKSVLTSTELLIRLTGKSELADLEQLFKELWNNEHSLSQVPSDN